MPSRGNGLALDRLLVVRIGKHMGRSALLDGLEVAVDLDHGSATGHDVHRLSIFTGDDALVWGPRHPPDQPRKAPAYKPDGRGFFLFGLAMASTSIDADLPLVASASTRQAQRMVRLGAMCSRSRSQGGGGGGGTPIPLLTGYFTSPLPTGGAF